MWTPTPFVRSVSADGLLIARPFSPLLFRQGEQAFPTLLLKVLQKEVPDEEDEVSKMIIDTEKEYSRLLKSGEKAALEMQTWTCSSCSAATTDRKHAAQRESDKLQPDAFVPKNKGKKKTNV